MGQKHSWLKIAAIAAAIVGAVLAVAAYLKKKSECLRDELDFDNSLYFDEDDALMDEEYTDSYDPMTQAQEEAEDTVCEEEADEVSEEADTDAVTEEDDENQPEEE